MREHKQTYYPIIEEVYTTHTAVIGLPIYYLLYNNIFMSMDEKVFILKKKSIKIIKHSRLRNR